ncbi:hypothetical protein HYQ46_005552 [Verticillium longisporum]|nr:hypothetical protein HYQ46_005552 [Verticillium longisporum]
MPTNGQPNQSHLAHKAPYITVGSHQSVDTLTTSSVALGAYKWPIRTSSFKAMLPASSFLQTTWRRACPASPRTRT